MIHIRVDDEELNSKRRFICGLGPELPAGDKYWFASEAMADRADCPRCNPDGPRKLGTPISELDGRKGGNAAWRRLCASWGHD